MSYALSVQPPQPARALRSSVGLSYAVQALLGLVVVADVLKTIAAVNVRSVLGGDDWSESEINRADGYTLVSASFYMVAFLATAVVYIIWFHRIRSNAEVFAPDLQRKRPGWAIGGWFIPFGNLWIPFTIATDVLQAGQTDPYAPRQKGRILLRVWWWTWLVSLFADRFAENAYSGSDDIEGVRAAARLLIASDLIDIVAAVLAALVVRQITQLLHAKAVERSNRPSFTVA